MTPETVTIASNAVIAKLHNPSREAKLETQRLLSYMVSGAENSDLFKAGRWDGRSSFFDFRAGTFPAGFAHFVASGLSRAGYKINHVRKPRPEALGPLEPVVDGFAPDPRYDYQMDVVNRLIKHGSIIAQVATGGGKSRIARLAYARINRPTLFLTTRSILMYQMKDAFERDMGVNCSVLGDGQFGHIMTDEHGNERQAVKKMCVGMVQTLVARLEEKVVGNEAKLIRESLDNKEAKRAEKLISELTKAKKSKAEIERASKRLLAELAAERPSPAQIEADAQARVDKQALIRAQTIRLLEKFEFVIGEEAHEASGNSYYDILKHCKNAHYRLALTATPFMKENEEANMRLMAAFGPIGARVTEKLLIDRGILAKPYFKVVRPRERPKHLQKTTAWQSAYRLGIVENDERNQDIIKEALRAVSLGLPVMILVQHKAHGADLLARLDEAGVSARFIFGEDNQEERQRSLTALGNGDINVLIGSTILDVGVDVPAVGMVILAGGGKAEVALRQRIGRGLRAKKSGPNVCLIVDFADTFNNHLARHAYQRLEIIKGTEGFGENILPSGADFDFIGLGLVNKVA